MKKIIFSVYNNIPVGERVTDYSKSQFTKHYDMLLENKKQYAQVCNADFNMYEVHMGYVDLQHYKIKKFENLLEEYDQVLYLDFDVIVKTKDNIFTSIDGFGVLMENAVDIYNQESAKILRESKVENLDQYHEFCKNEFTNRFQRDKYHRYKKAHYKKMMLFEDDIISTNDTIVNTGILIGNKNTKINYDKNLKHMKNIAPFENNEVFLSYLIERDNIKVTNLTDWHCVFDDLHTSVDGRMIHVINKRFEDV